MPAGLPGETVRELGRRRADLPPRAVARPAAGEIAGHLHPCARIVQRGRSVRRRCFATDGSRLIMPAFGAYTGSLNVLDRAYAGLFRRDGLMAYMIGADRVFAIAGAMLRPGLMPSIANSAARRNSRLSYVATKADAPAQRPRATVIWMRMRRNQAGTASGVSVSESQAPCAAKATASNTKVSGGRHHDGDPADQRRHARRG